MSQYIPFRVKDDEAEMLDTICKSESNGTLKRSEMIRLLIHREYKRRTTGKSVVKASEYSSDFRIGKPRKVSANVKSA